MADREEDDLQMVLRMSLQGSPPEVKGSKARESEEELPEARNRRVQRVLMVAAAEKRIRAVTMTDRIASPAASPAKPNVQSVSRTVSAAGPSVEASKVNKEEVLVSRGAIAADENVVRVEKVKKLENVEGRGGI